MPGIETSSPLMKDLCVKACWRSLWFLTSGRGGGQLRVGAERVAGRPSEREGVLGSAFGSALGGGELSLSASFSLSESRSESLSEEPLSE